jgi:hypothetical protein
LARLIASNALDRRFGVAKDFYGAQDGLADDRGGWTNTTTAERMLIEVASAELIIIRAIFGWAARQPSMVTDTTEGPRLLGPLAKGLTSHVGALTRALAALGIRPDKVERLPDLATYLAEKAATSASTASTASAAEEIGESAAVDVDAADAAVCSEEPTS